MFTLEAVEAALQGDDSGLVRAAGPGGIVRVDGERASVLVTRAGSGEVAFGRARAGGGAIDTVVLPEGFCVREVGVEGGKFVLTGVGGRVMRGTAEDFTTGFGVRGILVEPPAGTVELSNETEIAQAGEALVTIGGEQVWVRFDDAEPEQVRALLPRARELLASLDELGRSAVEYLWSRQFLWARAVVEEPDDENDDGPDEENDEFDDEDDDGPDEENDEFDDEDEDTATADDEDDEIEGVDKDWFFAEMVPTSFDLYQNGEFDLHFEGASGVFYLDGYWPSVRFAATNTPVDCVIEG